MKEQAISIIVFFPGEERRSFNIGDTMANGKIKNIEVKGSTFTIFTENSKTKYVNIQFVAQFKNK